MPQVSTHSVSKAGAQKKLRLAEVHRNSNKSLCNYVLSRKNGEQPVPVLGADGVMLADDRYQAELFNSYLASIFSISRKDLQTGKGSINMVKRKLHPLVWKLLSK